MAALFILGSILIYSCTIVSVLQSYKRKDVIKNVDLCDVLQIESGQIISTTGIYRGVEEYWSIIAPHECENPIAIHFDTLINNKALNNLNILDKFQEAYDHYDKYYIVLKVTGKIERKNEWPGYGQNGLMDTQIIPYQLSMRKFEYANYQSK